MSERNRPSVQEIAGVPMSSRRGVLLLAFDGDRFVNFPGRYKMWADGKRGNERRQFFSRFSMWTGGHHSTDAHKYNKKQKKGRDYPNVITFECRGVAARVYGFKTHPKASDPRFEVAVVVHFTTKYEFDTDERNLARCQSLHDDVSVQRAVRRFFET